LWKETVPDKYRFDDVEIDLRNFQVLKAGKPLSLEPKAFNVLVFLVENRGRLIEKKELIDAVWGDAFVTENVLTRVIGQLRKGLGDDVKEARYIETVPTRGYRFIAQSVTEETNESASAPSAPETAPPFPVGAPHSNYRWYAIAALALIAVAGIALAVLSTLRTRSAPQYLQIASSTQITTSSGLSLYPTFSPDGTQVAYCADRGKGFEIFVKQLAPGGKETQITSDGNQNMEPAWSPDGSQIAYSSNVRRGIWSIPAQGGTPRKLTDFGSHPAWSRDSQWIAFHSAPMDDYLADAYDVTSPSTIWVVRPDGSDARQVTHPDNPTGRWQGAPSWSPDSKRIVFVSNNHTVWSISANGTGLVRLTEPGYLYRDPVYTPDGTSVVFGAVTVAGDIGIYGLSQVRVSPDTSAPLGKPVQILNSSGVHTRNLAFSADGKKLVYAAQNMTGSLHSLSLSKTGEPAGEPSALISNVGCRNTGPGFSPDGSKITFISCSGRAGMRAQIWLMNADGGNAHQLTLNQTDVFFPMWHPDGRHIFLVNPGGKLDSVDTETLQEKLVTQIQRGFDFPSPSPDGSRLAMHKSTEGVLNIWIQEITSGKLKQLTFEKNNVGFPLWSPDGRYIAVETEKDGDNDIGFLPSSGGPVVHLTPYHGKQWIHSWSTDGDRILYAKKEDDLLWNIWSVSRSTKIEKQLTHYTNTNAYVRYPAMSPRGDQVVYEYTESASNLWMLEFK
jgi:Tol biopolymer transport system component/DNA-binding winged helix-turn-helix (wHTH) protein